MGEIHFGSYSMWTQKKSDLDWYEWCVFVADDAPVLAKIEAVQYTLHPTFPDPVRTVTDRASRFALYSAGWGGFGINVTVTLTDRSKVEARYFLELENDSWPRASEPEDLRDADAAAVLGALHHEKFRWRKQETLSKDTALVAERIGSALSRLQEKRLVRKAYFHSVDGKDLWGATSVVGLAPAL
jgi:transcription initiation factor IIF auxiliary subunit